MLLVKTPWRLLKRVTHDLLTGIDGHTYSYARVVGLIFCLAFLFFQGWSVIVLRAAFEPLPFGTAATGLLFSTGYAVSKTANTEPPV